MLYEILVWHLEQFCLKPFFVRANLAPMSAKEHEKLFEILTTIQLKNVLYQLR